MIAIVRKRRWAFFGVDWFTSAESSARLWSRLCFVFDVGWHCWGFGLALRVAPATETRRITIGLGPMTVGVEVHPKPSPFCECCGRLLAERNDDCLAHPIPDDDLPPNAETAAAAESFLDAMAAPHRKEP